MGKCRCHLQATVGGANTETHAGESGLRQPEVALILECWLNKMQMTVNRNWRQQGNQNIPWHSIRLLIQMQILPQFWKDHRHPCPEPSPQLSTLPPLFSGAPHTGGGLLKQGLYSFWCIFCPLHPLALFPRDSAQHSPPFSDFHTRGLHWTPSPARVSSPELRLKGDCGVSTPASLNEAIRALSQSHQPHPPASPEGAPPQPPQ